MTEYRYEPFKDVTEALVWCAENKPIKDEIGCVVKHTKNYLVSGVVDLWVLWQKAIPVEETYRKFWLWDVCKKSRWETFNSFYSEEGKDSEGDKLFKDWEDIKKRKVKDSLLVLDENNNDVTEEYLSRGEK